MTTTAYNGGAETGRERTPVVITENDIIFNCPACGGELVVDRAGEGLKCPCLHCGENVVVPAYRAPRAEPAPISRPMPAPPPAPVAPAAPVAEPIPVSEPPPAPARHFDFSAHSAEELERRHAELKHQLKENRSQDTEMRGHVNRATIELHRLQLKLKKLQDRQGDIEAELSALLRHLGPPPA